MLNEEVELKRKNYSKHPMIWFFFFHFATKFSNITLCNLKFKGEITLHMLRSWCHKKINKKYVFIYKISIIFEIMANKPWSLKITKMPLKN